MDKVDPVNCTTKLLEYFSFDHYDFINQIFGDRTCRAIIQKMFPTKYKFVVIPGVGKFRDSHHHVVGLKKNPHKIQYICSSKLGYQDMDVNKNDTLCQSYSLLTYFSIPISPDAKERQIDMIDMYETKLLGNATFLSVFKEELLHPENISWKLTDGSIMCQTMTPDEIILKIRAVLAAWRNYGYWFFIGEGHCPVAEGGTRKQKIKRKVFKKNKSIKKSYRIL